MSKAGWLGEAGTVTARRRMKDASIYSFLFPKTHNARTTVESNAGVYHTVRFIPKVVFSTLDETRDFARFIIAGDLHETCRALWQWVYDHIRYEKDETGKEQVRSPARLYADRKGDCDCFTTFLDSVLVNVSRLTGWKFRLVNRITKYDYAPNFQHIYPVVITPDGKRIIVDCVTENFDYEVPFTGKEDHVVMELEYLNGIDQQIESPDEWAADLGRLVLRKHKQQKEQKKQESKEETKGRGKLKKVVHAINKVNPTTALLRGGLLASMKLNVMNVAGRLKWTFLSVDKAKSSGFDMERWAKLRHVRDKLDQIFFAAGGEPEKLHEQILTGKGNRGKEVSGLGEVVTAAMLASATAALATLNELIKKIGPLKQGQDFSENENAQSDTVSDSDLQHDAERKSGKDGDDPEPVKFLDDPVGWVKQNPGTAVLAVAAAGALGYAGYKWYEKRQQEKELAANQPFSNVKPRREEIPYVGLKE